MNLAIRNLNLHLSRRYLIADGDKFLIDTGQLAARSEVLLSRLWVLSSAETGRTEKAIAREQISAVPVCSLRFKPDFITLIPFYKKVCFAIIL